MPIRKRGSGPNYNLNAATGNGTAKLPPSGFGPMPPPGSVPTVRPNDSTDPQNLPYPQVGTTRVTTPVTGGGNRNPDGSYMTADQWKAAQPKWNAGDDPGYQRVASQVAAQQAADAAQRRSNIQQALIAFGMSPGGFKDEYGDIDQGTKNLIDKNTNTGISQYARLLGTRQEEKTALLNRIGAKGLFRSGAKGAGLRKGQLNFDRSLADSMASLMQQLGGFSSSYANNELGRQQALQNAMAAAYANYNPPTLPSEYDPASYSDLNPNAARTVAYYGGRAPIFQLKGQQRPGGGV